MEEFVVLERARRIFRALEYCEAGESANKAGRKAYAAQTSISRLIRQHGGITGAKESVSRKIHEEEAFRDAVAYYLDSHSLVESAERFGVPEKRLRNRISHLRDCGYIETPTKRILRRELAESDELKMARKILQAVRCREKGLSYREASKKAGISDAHLINVIRKHGGIEGAKAYAKKRIIDEKNLREGIRLYISGRTIDRASELSGATEQRIRTRYAKLRKAGKVGKIGLRRAWYRVNKAARYLRSGKTLGEVIDRLNYKNLYDDLYRMRMNGESVGFEFYGNQHIKKGGK